MARIRLPIIIILAWSTLLPSALIGSDPPPSRPIWRPTGTTAASAPQHETGGGVTQASHQEPARSNAAPPHASPSIQSPVQQAVSPQVPDPASVIPPGEVRMYTVEAMLQRQYADAVVQGRVTPASASIRQPAPAPPTEPASAIAPAPPADAPPPAKSAEAPATTPLPAAPSITSPQKISPSASQPQGIIPPAPDGPQAWSTCAPNSCDVFGGCDSCLPGGSRFVFSPGDDVYPRIEVGGLLQIDAIWFQQDGSTEDVVGDVQDATDVRRARLHARGDLADDVSFMLEFDFGLVGRPNFMDTYVQFDDVPGLGAVRLGHWVQPFGLCAATSVRELLFLERGLPFIFMPFRQVGAGFKNSTQDERTLWAFSVYRFPTDVFAGSFGDSGYGLSGRVSRLLIDHAPVGRTLHIGGSYTANFPTSDQIRIATPPEVGFTQLDLSSGTPFPPYVDTGIVTTHSYQLLGGELAGNWGPLLIQYELVYAFLNQEEGPALTFPGSSLEVAYVLTGEHHSYRKQAGSYARVIPKKPFGSGGSGAWEIAGRCSHIDLSDENIQGGKLTDFTFGLNWYLNRFTKLQANYIHAILDRGTADNGHSNIAAIRAQIDF